MLFVITFVTSIPALLLYDPVLNDTGYITGAGGETQVLLAAFLELLLIVANIGTAVVLFPVLKRQSEPAALGFVAARVVESAFIAVGILSVLAVVTLRQDLAGGGTDPATLQTVGRSLVAIKDWTFLLGPGFVVGILIVKGFKPSPILYDDGRHAGVDGPLIPGLAAPEPAAPAMAAP